MRKITARYRQTHCHLVLTSARHVEHMMLVSPGRRLLQSAMIDFGALYIVSARNKGGVLVAVWLLSIITHGFGNMVASREGFRGFVHNVSRE